MGKTVNDKVIIPSEGPGQVIVVLHFDNECFSSIRTLYLISWLFLLLDFFFYPFSIWNIGKSLHSALCSHSTYTGW